MRNRAIPEEKRPLAVRTAPWMQPRLSSRLGPRFMRGERVSVTSGQRARAPMHRTRLQATGRSMLSPPRRFLLPRHPLLQNFPLQEPASLRSRSQMQLAALLFVQPRAASPLTPTHAYKQGYLRAARATLSTRALGCKLRGGATSSAPPRTNDSRHLPPCLVLAGGPLCCRPFPSRQSTNYPAPTLVLLPWTRKVR